MAVLKGTTVDLLGRISIYVQSEPPAAGPCFGLALFRLPRRSFGWRGTVWFRCTSTDGSIECIQIMDLPQHRRRTSSTIPRILAAAYEMSTTRPGMNRTRSLTRTVTDLPARDACHTQPGAERQRRMSSGQFARSEPFAARGLCYFGIKVSKSLRRNL